MINLSYLIIERPLPESTRYNKGWLFTDKLIVVLDPELLKNFSSLFLTITRSYDPVEQPLNGFIFSAQIFESTNDKSELSEDSLTIQLFSNISAIS